MISKPFSSQATGTVVLLQEGSKRLGLPSRKTMRIPRLPGICGDNNLYRTPNVLSQTLCSASRHTASVTSKTPYKMLQICTKPLIIPPCQTILTCKNPPCKRSWIDEAHPLCKDVPERRKTNMEIGQQESDSFTELTQAKLQKNSPFPVRPFQLGK